MTFDDLFRRYGARYRWLATTTVLFGLVALGMSITIVDVATPYIEGAFGMSVSAEQWLSTGFLAATTISIMVAPWLASRFGHRATYLGTLVLFLVASLAGGASSDAVVIVLSRVGLGAATGLVRPVAMEVLFTAFGRHRRGVAMAIYGMSLGLPLTLASVLGGWLVETLHWRAVFYAPIPFCLVSLVMAWPYLPNRHSAEEAGRFDWLGLVLLSIGIFALLTALANWYRWGADSNGVMLSLLATGASAVAYVAWEIHHPKPLIDLRLFVQPAFASVSLAVFLFGGVFYGIVYLLPLFVEAVQGYSPVEAGMLFLPSTVVLAVLVPVVGPLSDRYSPVLFAVPAIVCASFGVWIMSHAGVDTSFGTLATAMALIAVGMAGFPPPILAAGINSLPRHLVHYGSGAVNFALQLGGSVITSLVVLFLDRSSILHAAHMAHALTGANTMMLEYLHRVQGILSHLGVASGLAGAGAFHLLGKVTWLEAYVLGFRFNFTLVLIGLVVTIAPTLLLEVFRRRRTAAAG